MWLGTVNKIKKHMFFTLWVTFYKRKTSYKLTGGYVMFCYNMLLYMKGHLVKLPC